MKISLHMGKKIYLSVFAVFILIYLLSMLLVTWREKEDIELEYLRKTDEAEANFRDYNIRFESRGVTTILPIEPAENETYLWKAMSNLANVDSSGHFLLSAAVYDETGSIFQQMSGSQIQITLSDFGELFGELQFPYSFANLEDYMTEEEIRRLAGYEAENGKDINHPKYEYQVMLSDTNRLSYMDVIENHWKSYTGTEEEIDQILDEYEAGWGWPQEEDIPPFETSIGKDGTLTLTVITEKERVWNWDNPDIKSENTVFAPLEAQIVFPGISAGYHTWEGWLEEPWLQEFPEQIELREGYTTEGWKRTGGGSRYQIRTLIYPPYVNGDGKQYTLILRIEQHPWMAALDNLKYIWAGSFLFLAACAALTLWIMERTYRQKERLEAQRRDFINVMAHEIKTPISVIRGFSENMKENPETKKREYYLDQIIRQTEEIDDLVKEMITTSKAADWKQVKIGDVLISVRSVIEDEMDRLEVQTEEKRLNVTLRCEDDWMLPADRKLLEQAFFAILSNAVSYNREEGRIRIVLKKGICTIENTGDNIPPEHLPHVCEMFYTVNQSRGGREKHLGMGLYLARQIFALHGAELKVENTEEGVRVTVEKKRSNRDKV